MAGGKTSAGKRAGRLIQTLLSLGIVAVVALLGTLFYTKLDLTAEKRHSLTESTEQLLDELEDPVFIRCYLHGELPAQFKKLEQSIQERLAEFADYSDGMLEYEFIDPYESGDEQTENEVVRALDEKGLGFTVHNYEIAGTAARKLIWPAAVLSYRGTDYPIQFYKSAAQRSEAEMIGSSINNLEYELARNLRSVVKEQTPAIAILEGQGELGPYSFADVEQTLLENYAVDRVRIDEQLNSLTEKIDGMRYRLKKYDLLIVAKPDSLFSDKDRLIIDQYLMAGGKIIWMLDRLKTDLDSLRANQETFALQNDLGVYEQLFEYGVAVNRELVLDYECEEIVVDAGPQGNQRDYELKKWYYSPVVVADSVPHPILTNLGPVRFQFCGSLDTVGENPNIRKRVLLETSEYNLGLKEPALVSMARINFGLEYFERLAEQNVQDSGEQRNKGKINKSLAVLLEGKFTSHFKHTLPAILKNDSNFAFRSESRPTAQLVIADGDFGRNGFVPTPQGPQVIPLGYDRNRGSVYYDNKEFLLNAVNYLLDDDALISIRSRTIESRLLRADTVVGERQRWQVINVALPLACLVILGLALRSFRKRRYRGA